MMPKAILYGKLELNVGDDPAGNKAADNEPAQEMGADRRQRWNISILARSSSSSRPW